MIITSMALCSTRVWLHANNIPLLFSDRKKPIFFLIHIDRGRVLVVQSSNYGFIIWKFKYIYIWYIYNMGFQYILFRHIYKSKKLVSIKISKLQLVSFYNYSISYSYPRSGFLKIRLTGPVS